MTKERNEVKVLFNKSKSNWLAYNALKFLVLYQVVHKEVV